jgi:hypothetical protein
MGGKVSSQRPMTRQQVLNELRECWPSLGLSDDLRGPVESYVVVNPKKELREAFRNDPDRARGLARMILEGKYSSLPCLFTRLPIFENLPLALEIKREWQIHSLALEETLIQDGMWSHEIHRWMMALAPSEDRLISIAERYNLDPWFELKIDSTRRFRIILDHEERANGVSTSEARAKRTRANSEEDYVDYRCGCRQKLPPCTHGDRPSSKKRYYLGRYPLRYPISQRCQAHG